MWKVKSKERILDSEFVQVDKDDVLLPHEREIKDLYKVTIKDCAAIEALTADGKVVLKKEYRHCYGQDLIEIPAGVLWKTEKIHLKRRRENCKKKQDTEVKSGLVLERL